MISFAIMLLAEILNLIFPYTYIFNSVAITKYVFTKYFTLNTFCSNKVLVLNTL